MGQSIDPIGAIVSLFQTGANVYQGEQGRKAQKKALQNQERVQADSLARAHAEERRAELERRRLQRRRPNLMSVITNELRLENSGAASTLLSGPSGVDRHRLTLGQPSKLGAG